MKFTARVTSLYWDEQIFTVTAPSKIEARAVMRRFIKKMNTGTPVDGYIEPEFPMGNRVADFRLASLTSEID